MKKFLALLSMFCIGCTCFAEVVTTTYYGEKASNSYKNPCRGETIRICAVISREVSNLNGNPSIVLTSYNEIGEVTEKTVVSSHSSFEEVVKEAISEAPINAVVTISSGEDGEK